MAQTPKYPLYIVSKGRADTRLTSKALERMETPYHIIVEAQEFDEYAAVIDPGKILILDQAFKDKYDTFQDTPNITSTGSGPARNFAWEHSIKAGFDRHWVMDDNIRHFYRLHNNLKIVVSDGTVFRAMEDFADRYTNLAMCGPQYQMFAPRKRKMSPLIMNTRVYSCNLIKNDVDFRWRGRFNEDTDLSLRMLKEGWCTALFIAFLQGKANTLKMKGGNTDTVYVAGTMPKSMMIVDMHPDVAKLVWKFGRYHHHVDYRKFKKNKLIRRKGVKIDIEPNEYGMQLQMRRASDA